MLDAVPAGDLPAHLRFECADIEQFPADADRYDVIVSNAALHWVEEHDALFARLASALAPQGQLAVQMPAMHDDESHRVAAELIAEEPYRTAANGWRHPQPVLAPEAYARLLFLNGFEQQTVRLIVYPHVLAAPDAVVEWFKGTLLAEYSRHMPPDVYDRFLGEYRRRLLARIDASRPFFFPFKRILMWGQLA
jgi:trans-aconitate 2-methyltransferase